MRNIKVIMQRLGFILTSMLCWVLFMLIGESISALSAGDESKLYYVSSFASLFFLILICILTFKLVTFDKQPTLKQFVKINWSKLLLVISPMPIMFCYLGWCIEIFTVGFGAAKIFGFNEAVTGILFNASTVFAGTGYILSITAALKSFGKVCNELFKL